MTVETWELLSVFFHFPLLHSNCILTSPVFTNKCADVACCKSHCEFLRSYGDGVYLAFVVYHCQAWHWFCPPDLFAALYHFTHWVHHHISLTLSPRFPHRYPHEEEDLVFLLIFSNYPMRKPSRERK